MVQTRRNRAGRAPLTVLGLALFIALAHADAAGNAQRRANQLATALVEGDYMQVAELTHPRVVSRVGGPRAVASSLRNATLAAQLQLHRMEFSAPRQMVRAGNEYVAIVPFESEATLRGQNLTINSFYLGFSANGDTWHFIDCQGVGHATIKRLAPGYDNALNLSGC